MSNRTLIIRADASVQTGTGHLMRTLALAQEAIKQGDEVIYITGCTQPALLKRLADAKFMVHRLDEISPHGSDIEETLAICAAYPGAWVILDGYHFDPLYQERVRAAGHPLMIIDDLGHLPHYHADVLLNQNPNASKIGYSTLRHTVKLFGPKYALLRPEFTEEKAKARHFSVLTRKILVTMGGSDPFNVTPQVLHALDNVHDEKLEIIAVSGGANLNFSQLTVAAAKSPHSVRLMANVFDMAELMTWADLAISAAGSTCLELACMGLPAMLLTLSDNQRDIALELGKSKTAITLGTLDQVKWETLGRQVVGVLNDPDGRRELSRKSQALVDGQGVQRALAGLTLPTAQARAV